MWPDEKLPCRRGVLRDGVCHPEQTRSRSQGVAIARRARSQAPSKERSRDPAHGVMIRRPGPDRSQVDLGFVGRPRSTAPSDRELKLPGVCSAAAAGHHRALQVVASNRSYDLGPPVVKVRLTGSVPH
jgi:hypothetical protein